MQIIPVFSSLLWPFILCYFSTITTNRLKSLGQIAYDSNWYDYPLDCRLSIVLIILRSQKPACFSGYIIYSTLETFAQVKFNDGQFVV